MGQSNYRVGLARVTISWHRFPAVLLTCAAVAVAGCQSTSDDQTPSAPPPSAAASPSSEESAAESARATDASKGEETSVFELEVGDCFSADSDTINSVVVVDCAQPHTYEAFFVFDHDAGPDEAFPGDDVILEYADTACRPPFEEFVGKDYESSIWYITSVTPSAETWATGDREIVCTLDQQDANDEPIEVTGSAEASGE
jgi:hypothetical protein